MVNVFIYSVGDIEKEEIDKYFPLEFHWESPLISSKVKKEKFNKKVEKFILKRGKQIAKKRNIVNDRAIPGLFICSENKGSFTPFDSFLISVKIKLFIDLFPLLLQLEMCRVIPYYLPCCLTITIQCPLPVWRRIYTSRTVPRSAGPLHS